MSLPPRPLIVILAVLAVKFVVAAAAGERVVAVVAEDRALGHAAAAVEDVGAGGQLDLALDHALVDHLDARLAPWPWAMIADDPLPALIVPVLVMLDLAGHEKDDGVAVRLDRRRCWSA